MKTGSEKSADTTSTTATRTSQEPFFGKKGEGGFFETARQGVPPFIQAKLTINQPGDMYEQEADRVADQVVQRLETPSTEPTTPLLSAVAKPSTAIQTKADPLEQEEQIQRKEEEGLEEEIQCKEESASPAQPGDEAGSGFSTRLQASKGGGVPLEEHTRSDMESALASDLSGVRIHTGVEAASMSKSIHAQAFTHGTDVYFNEGKFDVESGDGKRLLAHELVHTQQQQGRVGRMIQRAVSAQDVATIEGYFSFSLRDLFSFSDLKRSAILRKLSEYPPEDVTEIWNVESGKLKDKLEYFVDDFKSVEDFQEFPLQIAAIFKALEPDKSVKRIKSLLQWKVNSDAAVRILYLMQGLSATDLEKAFELNEKDSPPTKFDLFKMALPPGEVARIQQAFEHDQKASGIPAEKTDDVANKIYEIFGVQLSNNATNAGPDQEKAFNERAKELDDLTISPQKAIQAYKHLKLCSADMVEEFGYKYPELFSKITDSLPIEFLRSSEFGLQKIEHNKKDIEKRPEKIEAYHLLYKIAKPYRFLYNNPLPFANIIALLSQTNADERELKKDLFEHRTKKIEKTRAQHSKDGSVEIAYLKSSVPADFVPFPEMTVFDMGLDWIFRQVRNDRNLEIQSAGWMFNPQTEPGSYMLALLSKLLVKYLAIYRVVPYSFHPLEDLLDTHPGLIQILITEPLPVIKVPFLEAPMGLAEELETDEDLLSIYLEDVGIFQMLSDPELWTGEEEANGRLETALMLATGAGFGEKIAGFVERRKKKPVGKEDTKAQSQEAMLKESNKSLSSTSFEDSITKELGLLFPKFAKIIPRLPLWMRYLLAVMNLKKMGILQEGQGNELLLSSGYLMEGVMGWGDKFNLFKRADVSDLDLAALQRLMGNQMFGMEFGGEKAENSKALLSIHVDERQGFARINSPALNIKSMHMQFSDMFFSTDDGIFKTVLATINWPSGSTSDEGSTELTIDGLELNKLRFQDKGSLFYLEKLNIKGLSIHSNKPIANYTQMNNWYELSFSVMQFLQDVFSILMTSFQVASQQFAPDMIKDLVDKQKTGTEKKTIQNPQKALSDLLLQRFGTDQKIKINYTGLEVKNMVFNDMGLIKSFSTGASNMEFENYETESGEREMKFGFSGEHLNMDGADISGLKTKKMAAGKFDLGFYFNEPDAGGRDRSSLKSLSQLSSQENPVPVSKLKRMSFTLNSLTGEGVSMLGFDMKQLPFDGVSGEVRFNEEQKETANAAYVPPTVGVTLKYVTGVNFLELPYPADLSTRIISNKESQLEGDFVDAELTLKLNSEKEQQKEGWKVKEMNLVKLTIPILDVKNIALETQGSRVEIAEGSIANTVLRNFTLKADETGDNFNITSLDLRTGGINMQGIGLKTAAGLVADLPKFKAGSMEFGIVVTSEEDKTTNTQYTFDAKGVSTSGHLAQTTPADLYDPSKKPTTLATDFNMPEQDLGGVANVKQVDGKTKAINFYLTAPIPALEIPSLNVKSDEYQISAPTLADHPILLKNIDASVDIEFDDNGDAKAFTLTCLRMEEISTYGLKVRNIEKKRDILDLPENVHSRLVGFYVDQLAMKKRLFTASEIAAMKQDKKPLPDEKTTWDLAPGKDGNLGMGFTSSNLPKGLTLNISDSLKVQMGQVNSGVARFEFVSTDKFTYSIEHLDALNVKVTQDGKTLVQGTLKDAGTSGSVEQSIVGTGSDAKKRTVLSTDSLDVPKAIIQRLNISSSSVNIEIPENAEHESAITGVTGSFVVTITEPSDKEKQAMKAKGKEAPSEIVADIKTFKIAQVKGYGLRIKSPKKTNLPVGIAKSDSTEFDVKLPKDAAGIMNNLVLEGFNITVPKEGEMYYSGHASIGKSADATNQAVQGVDFENITAQVRKTILGGKFEKYSLLATIGLSANKITFDGKSDEAFTIAIEGSELKFPVNFPERMEQPYNVDYSSQKNEPWLGESKVDIYADILDATKSVFMSPKIIVKRQKREDGTFEFITMIEDPSLNLKVLADMHNNVAGELKSVEVSLAGQGIGVFEIQETDADFAKNDATEVTNKKGVKERQKDMQKAYVIKPQKGGSLCINKGTEVVMKLNPTPPTPPMNHDQWEAAEANPQTIKTDEDVIEAYNAGQHDAGRKHEFDFLDGARSGNVTVGMFGEHITIPIVGFPKDDKTTEWGFINLRAAIRELNTHFTLWNSPVLATALETLHTDDDDGNLYLAAAGKNLLALVPDVKKNVKNYGTDQELVRLSALLDFQKHKPAKLEDEPPQEHSWYEWYDNATQAAGESIEQAWQAFVNEPSFFNLTFGLEDVVIDFSLPSLQDKKHRGILDFIDSKDKQATFNLKEGHLNMDEYDNSSQRAIDPRIWQTRTFGLEGKISSYGLPKIRYVTDNLVFSAEQIDLNSLAFKFKDFNNDHITLTPESIDITGLKIDIKK